MSIKNFAACFGAALVLLTGPASAATFVGQEVQIDYIHPDIDTVGNSGGDNGQYLIRDGVEVALGNVFAVDISDNFLNLSVLKDYTLDERATFQGIRISDTLGSFRDFTGFSLIDSNLANAPALSFDADSLFVNLLGDESALARGTSLQASIDVAPVPLPAAGLMLLAGVGAFGALRRFSKQPVAA